ncbi:cation:proton antiporter [Halobacteria archaeon AArc-curdl1]|uniref:Cation:proton antiporter n=1 Tax=Natronosalvus hydrolyticus TaxID=2979988 RepID=A0AAP2Z5H0_9EURY|nr:cation:proton antiporter [Halobacteria archaeon AArc-curdl1]
MSELLTTISLMFIITGPFLLIGNRFDLPTVPFLIIAGIVAGFVIDENLALELARYGIALLVFMFGIRIDLTNARPILRDSEVAAIGQILVVGGLGIGVGILFGIPLAEAVYLGIAVAFSSTIVGTALLQTEIRQELVRGRLAETIHFIQDLVAIVILLVLGAETLTADPIATQLGYGVVLFALAFLLDRYLLDVVGRLADDSDELMIIGIISLLVLFVAAATLAGVSIVVGAFAAGLAIRYNPVEHPGLFNGLVSIRDFFLAIFFVTVGALVVVPFVELGVAASVEKLLLVVGLVILTAVIKPVVTTAILIKSGYEARTSTLTSLSSDQISEFALIIAIEALLLEMLTQNVFDAIILAAAVTMITSSLTQQYNERIYRAVSSWITFEGTHAKIDERSSVPERPTEHVIIVGYGRKGQLLVDACENSDLPYVVIDNDPARLDSISSACDAYVFGDAMEMYTWDKANVEAATLVVSTVNSTPVSNRLLSFDFEADLILHTDDAAEGVTFFERGALYVSVSDVLAGEELAQQLRRLFDDGLSPEQLREERIAELNTYVAVVKDRDSGIVDVSQ